MPSGEYMDHWRNKGAVAYMAEHPERNWGDTSLPWGKMASRPSIHMPRFASRITLEVTAVRVERLRDISEDDAIAEGCPGTEFLDSNGEPKCYDIEPQEQFAALWESIYAKRPGCSWNDNPLVFVIEFRRLP